MKIVFLTCLFAALLAFAGCTTEQAPPPEEPAASEPAQTAESTRTPEPTWTPESTWTPEPTQAPTPTRRPTATPAPTPIPTPALEDLECEDVVSEIVEHSRKVDSSADRISDIELVEEVSRGTTEIVCKGMLDVGSRGTFPSKFTRDFFGSISFDSLQISEFECSFFLDDVINMSERRSVNTTRPRILKIYDQQKVSNTDKKYVCSGLAKMSQGGDVSIEFHIEEDRDGDRFIGYKVVE